MRAVSSLFMSTGNARVPAAGTGWISAGGGGVPAVGGARTSGGKFGGGMATSLRFGFGGTGMTGAVGTGGATGAGGGMGVRAARWARSFFSSAACVVSSCNFFNRAASALDWAVVFCGNANWFSGCRSSDARDPPSQLLSSGVS